MKKEIHLRDYDKLIKECNGNVTIGIISKYALIRVIDWCIEPDEFEIITFPDDCDVHNNKTRYIIRQWQTEYLIDDNDTCTKQINHIFVTIVKYERMD